MSEQGACAVRGQEMMIVGLPNRGLDSTGASSRAPEIKVLNYVYVHNTGDSGVQKIKSKLDNQGRMCTKGKKERNKRAHLRAQ